MKKQFDEAESAVTNDPRWRPTFHGVVYPAQCDAMGHLNTAFYVQMFDIASLHLCHLLTDWRATNSTDLRWADVKHVINYVGELRVGALVRGYSSIENVGGKSLVICHRLYNALTKSLAATMEQTTVRFSLTERKAVLLEQATRSAALSMMPIRTG